MGEKLVKYEGYREKKTKNSRPQIRLENQPKNNQKKITQITSNGVADLLQAKQQTEEENTQKDHLKKKKRNKIVNIVN